MKVIATQPGIYNGNLVNKDEAFELREFVGLRFDKSTGKKVKTTFSVESQFSDNWMKKADVYEVIPEDNAAPKKRGRPFATKVESSNIEVI